MAAQFLYIEGQTYIISNTMSILDAGFHPCKSYYNHRGDTLRYFKDDDGRVISRISARRRQPVINCFKTTEEANEHFKRMNAGQTFQTGKWVPEKNNRP